MATIKAIEARTIHQIQSGQVIVDLCSVVKELVENSIDAGATNIEVRFKNQGLDSIEVQDNGFGISSENYESLALKHYTSKLSSYSDLESLETFGFRGEALSSLCALSKFSVITCLASDAPKGTRLEFETSGKLQSTSVVAAQKGTTVCVDGLFQNLPVRRRELERNIKREWNKVLVVLNQYACIQTELKFSVSQQPNKGRRMVLFSTKGNKTTRENIVNVFGAKTLTVLLQLELELELEPTTSTQKSIKSRSDDQTKIIRVIGHVSRPAHGEGRQTPDRQMFFVNGRPCGLPQFAKVFNEVYKSYNSSQSPFIFADIQLDTHLYDVNVSPDKRTILLHDQTRMLDNLRESLTALFESQDYALPTSQLQPLKPLPPRRTTSNGRSTPLSDSGSNNPVRADDSSKRTPAPSNSHLDQDGEDTRPVNDDSEEGEGESDMTKKGLSAMEEPHQAAQGNALISRWVERKCTSRVNTLQNREMSDNTAETSKHIAPLHAAQDDHDLRMNSDDGSDNVVADFRARLEELKRKKGNEDAEEGPEAEAVVSEPPIPALAAPSRLTDPKSIRITPSPSNKRAAAEVATITIGDHTVTSIIGSTNKRQRVETLPNRRSPTQQRTRKSAPVPSFNGRLSQLFAAQAARNQADTRQLNISTEIEEDLDHSDSSSSEQLFVGDGNNDEDCNDPENELGSEKELNSVKKPDASRTEDDEDKPSLPASPREEKPDQDSENLAGSSSDQSDDEYEPDMSQEPNGEADSKRDAQSADVVTSEETEKRSQNFLKGSTRKKDWTCQLEQTLRVSEDLIRELSEMQQKQAYEGSSDPKAILQTDALDAEDAEEKLSLTISKSDFANMKIIGQFNLGFILASRPGGGTTSQRNGDDELFIIDQHATDEKYNFERLQANTVVQSQRLVHPKPLELTAVEEDIVQENLEALETNGFILSYDDSGDEPVGTRCQLLSLPLSRETTFSLADLEELISLLQEHQGKTVPRPSKVRKMFAMRACRSSVMIGKSLSSKQMEKLVRHMGELDKPWNCPHGRPTMRHLCGLGAWNDLGWKEGDGFGGAQGTRTDWAAYTRGDTSI
ncbi:DNA mismatch repair protein MutL, partial [Xylariaceae sp. FL0255]